MYHRTAVSGIKRSYGSYDALTNAQTLSVDFTTYIDNLEIDQTYSSKYYFSTGYLALGNTGSGTFHYFAKDHEGNVRAVVNQDGTVEQVNNYFAFGGLLNDVTTGSDLQKRKYNGKELDRMFGLDWYDYGARNFDAVIGRWHSMDPLCEKYYSVSPYAYCCNNPVNAVDPDGKKVWVFATKLPGGPNILSKATHTFTVVQTSDGQFHRFSYGPINDNPILSVSGTSPIVLRNYSDDKKAQNDYFNNVSNENIKNVVEVSVPEGMTSSEFDQAVINSAKDFEGNTEIKYNITAHGYDQGNCNSSTTSLLKNAGTSNKELKNIENQIPGIKWGFGNNKPWTKKEREKVKKEQEQKIKQNESLMNNIGF